MTTSTPSSSLLGQRVLVVGATGTTGRAVVRRLAADHEPVVTSRRPGEGQVAFDWYDDATWPGALAGARGGVQAAYLVPPVGDPDPVEVVRPFVEQAAGAGLRRAVVLGAQPIEAGEPGVGGIQTVLPDLIGEWAVARPSWFLQNLIGDHPLARGLRERGELRTATGDGRVPLVDVDDIADVVGSVIEAPEASNREIVITGPRAWSYGEVAALIGRETGRTVVHRRLTAEQVRDEVYGDLPAWLGLSLGRMDEKIATGAWSEPTDEVLAVTGHAPRTLEDFVRRHRDELMPR